jgi:Protein of unknown function (DUF4244)
MLAIITLIQSFLLTRRGPTPDRSFDDRLRGNRGQATAEYALVLIGAAAIALLLIAWATKTDRIGRLFDFVLDRITGRVK